MRHSQFLRRNRRAPGEQPQSGLFTLLHDFCTQLCPALFRILGVQGIQTLGQILHRETRLLLESADLVREPVTIVIGPLRTLGRRLVRRILLLEPLDKLLDLHLQTALSLHYVEIRDRYGLVYTTELVHHDLIGHIPQDVDEDGDRAVQILES